MSQENLSTGTLSMKESSTTSDLHKASIGSTRVGNQAPANHDSSTHDKQKKWMHQIVRGWEGSNNNQMASPPRPPSPTMAPPAWDGSSVTFGCLNAFASKIDSSIPTATSVLCRHCRCPSQEDACDASRVYERIVSIQKDTAVKVSMWESRSVTAQLNEQGTDALLNCDQILLCISMLDVWSQARSEDGLNDSRRLWSALAEILLRWKEELKCISKPIAVVLLGIVKPSDGPTFDDYSTWFSSMGLMETVLSLDSEHKMRWYTPILRVEEDGTTPASAEVPSLNKKRKLSTSWNPNHTVDFCFQSMIEHSLLLQKEKSVVIIAADTAGTAANEVNDPQENDSNESPLPVAKKQRKESTETVSPNSVVIDVIDLTATVSADADEDSPKVSGDQSSPVRRGTRNRR
jgi:hypothetical protein